MISTGYPSTPSPEAFSAPYFFFTNDREGSLTYLSPSVTDVLGFLPEEQVGNPYTKFFDFNHPYSSKFGFQREQFEEGKAQVSNFCVACQAKNGIFRVLKVQTYGEAGEDGFVAFNHGIAQDITESHLSKLDLQERLEKLEVVKQALSDREDNVLNRVMDGRLNKSIAKELGVTERTIESARSRLMKKFGANTSAELVRMATEHRMLSRVVGNVPSSQYATASTFSNS